jgi:TRAP-type C4-dicarboxylate transport system substrate-binding protein
MERGVPARAATTAGTLLMSSALSLALSLALSFAVSWALPPAAAHAQDKSQNKTYVMKISTPTINAAPDQFAREYGALLEKDTGGRIKAEVYPANQLGSIPRQIEGTQFGSIQCSIIPPEFFVGIDDRFEVLATPGLVASMEQGQRVAADPAVRKLFLGLGADKGLYGVGLFMAEQSAVISKTPIRHLADFKGKKLRIFASQFQSVAFERLGVTPVAMSLGDVLPAIQQGAIDGAIAGLTIYTGMHFQDAAKYVTTTNQPAIFLIVELNRKWYESLPADLQKIVDDDAVKEVAAINSWTIDFNNKARQRWLGMGGELISLPADEQAAMMKTLANVGEDVSKTKSRLNEAYETVTQVAQRTR